MDSLFVFGMFWDPRYSHELEIPDCEEFKEWFAKIRVIDDYTRDFDFPEDLDDTYEFIGRRKRKKGVMLIIARLGLKMFRLLKS